VPTTSSVFRAVESGRLKPPTDTSSTSAEVMTVPRDTAVFMRTISQVLLVFLVTAGIATKAMIAASTMLRIP